METLRPSNEIQRPENPQEVEQRVFDIFGHDPETIRSESKPNNYEIRNGGIHIISSISYTNTPVSWYQSLRCENRNFPGISAMYGFIFPAIWNKNNPTEKQIFSLYFEGNTPYHSVKVGDNSSKLYIMTMEELLKALKLTFD